MEGCDIACNAFVKAPALAPQLLQAYWRNPDHYPRSWILRLTLIVVAYLVIYFTFGYFIA